MRARTFSASADPREELAKLDGNLNSVRPVTILLAMEWIVEMRDDGG